MTMLFPIVVNAEEGYYYVGDQTIWDLSNKTYKFSKMDDGKTWTLTMPIDSSDDFQIAPLSVESWNDSRYKVAVGSSGLTGMMNFSPFDGTNFSVNTETPGSYTIKIVPSEMTYEITLDEKTYKDGDIFTYSAGTCDLKLKVISAEEKKCMIVDCTYTNIGYITIPSEAEGFKIVSIGPKAFMNRLSLVKKVTISDGITNIGESAFCLAPDLIEVKMANSVTSIDSRAFAQCYKLESIDLSKNLKKIGSSAFFECNKLNYVNIPSLYAWLNIEFDGYLSNPLNYAHKLHINSWEETDITIPFGISKINDFAFYNSNITSVSFGNTVVSIGENAFANCGKLSSISIPNSIKTISKSAFQGCSGIEVVTLDCEDVDSWFRESNLKTVMFGNNVKRIGLDAFYGCKGLTSIDFPEGLLSIGQSAFQNCSGLTKINFPESLTDIGGGAFENCSGLTGINLPKGLTNIGWDTFKGCSGLTSITVPEGVTSIGEGAFYGCI